MDAAGVVVSVLQGLQDGGGDLSGVVLRVGGEARNRVENSAAIEELCSNSMCCRQGRGWGGRGLSIFFYSVVRW